jgi:iron(III) transport system substrate-binding protein
MKITPSLLSGPVHPCGRIARIWLLCAALALTFFSESAAQVEWKQAQESAKNEGRLVLTVPPSPEFRKALETVFKPRFGIDLEITTGTGPASVRRIIDEYKAGVRYFDLTLSSIENLTDSLLPMGAVESLEPYWILPEVKVAKNWWGGHMWGDKAKRYVYWPSASMAGTFWYNRDLVNPDEVRFYDDLLDPKWKGRIGLQDPRIVGAGNAAWTFLWQNKGEEYCKRLVQQDLLLHREPRVIADALARGKIAISIGPNYRTFEPHVKAGLPLKPFPPFKEGTLVTVGPGSPVIIKNQPHPNATKVFVNWYLSKEGQEAYTKALGQGTRRLDVDTSWLPEVGVRAAKDYLTVQEFHKYENQSEEKILTGRGRARELANKLLP